MMYISVQKLNLAKHMKKQLAFAAVALLFSMLSHAQGSLQFSQVKMVTTVQTVPAGKVWKILSAPYKNDVIGTVGSWNASDPAVEFAQSMLINGSVVYLQAFRMYDGSWRNFTGPTCQLPLWLPEGTTVQAGIGVRFLSVMEFNIIP